jgi:hypothetical protein
MFAMVGVSVAEYAPADTYVTTVGYPSAAGKAPTETKAASSG